MLGGGTLLVICVSLLTVATVALCGYGYAAVSSDLMISGEATVIRKEPTFGIKYMQEMTTDICKNAEIGVNEKLTDQRDNKQYWVQKMNDGNCWMMQNLGYELTAERINNSEINSGNTDIHASSYYTKVTLADGTAGYAWDSKSTYPPMATQTLLDASSGSVSKVANNVRGTYSWYFGNIFWMDPTSYTVCSSTTNLHNCTNISNPNIYRGTDWSYATTGKVYDATTKVYDTHYNIGAYYQFATVTASSLIGTTGQAGSSICPKGWQLPLGGSANTGSKSLYNLYTTYGYTTKQSATINGVTKNVSQDPLYLVRSGLILASATNAVQYARTRGYLWTGFAGTTSNGFYLRINGSDFTRSSNDSRWYGLPVRCVAR